MASLTAAIALVAAASLVPPRGSDASSAVSETITTAKIKSAFAGEAALKASDISVSTDNGVVRLTGTVKSPDQITIATNLAQRQRGVARVEPDLEVR